MICKAWVTSALCAVALSAPTINYNPGAAERPVEMQILSEYFQMLGQKVQAGRNMATAPVCDLNNAVLPIASPTPLPPPSEGLHLKHVAIGRGTQNYTCTSNSTSAPVALGAIATLYNASCIASTYPQLLSLLPTTALQFNLSSQNQASLTPSNLAISGHHYFSNSTTPAFNLETTGARGMQLGFAPCAKNSSVPAPTDAAKGQGAGGLGAVTWLKLLVRDGGSGGLSEVYRVNTAGGSSPATCAGIEGTTFEVQYAAEYWFYASS